jgi:hypothetical protein
MRERVWRVGHEYRDRAGYPDDEFISWLATDAGSISNGGGICYRDRHSGIQIDA